MTYLELNAIFLVAVALFLLMTAAIVRGKLPWKEMGVALVILVALTAIFDNAIIGSGIVAYDASLLSGVYIGIAPIEDFAYTLAVVVIVPCIWVLCGRRRSR